MIYNIRFNAKLFAKVNDSKAALTPCNFEMH